MKADFHNHFLPCREADTIDLDNVNTAGMNEHLGRTG